MAQNRVDGTTILAAALFSLWRRTEGEARSIVNEAIQAYLSRTPAAKVSFDYAIQLLDTMKHAEETTGDLLGDITPADRYHLTKMRDMQLSARNAHSLSIVTAWKYADLPLREDLKSYIQVYGRTDPSLITMLKQDL